jgi:hypothetical protein
MPPALAGTPRVAASLSHVDLSAGGFACSRPELLDGIGAAIFGALFPLVVADLTHGTGHFNVSQGAIATAAGLGAALSAAVAGFIVVGAGYGAAFLALSAVAAVGLGLFVAMMPETAPGAIRLRAGNTRVPRLL